MKILFLIPIYYMSANKISDHSTRCFSAGVSVDHAATDVDRDRNRFNERDLPAPGNLKIM